MALTHRIFSGRKLTRSIAIGTGYGFGASERLLGRALRDALDNQREVTEPRRLRGGVT